MTELKTLLDNQHRDAKYRKYHLEMTSSTPVLYDQANKGAEKLLSAKQRAMKEHQQSHWKEK